MKTTAAADVDLGLVRRAGRLVEAVHAVVYFAPEQTDRYKAVGLKGGWMGYFASRSAALGRPPAEVVAAAFHGFDPRMVARAIPDAWGFADPADVLAARLDVARAALARLTDGTPATAAVPQALELAEAAARAACDPASMAGRPLFAAHASLPWPEDGDAIGRLWHATSLLREHRGDGHVALLVAEGIAPLEAHLLAAARGLVDTATQRVFRGWEDADWDGAAESLRQRGWLADDGSFTDAGAAAREALEARTDALAADPYARGLGAEGTARLVEALTPIAEAVVEGGGVPFPNPMGLAAPSPKQ